MKVKHTQVVEKRGDFFTCIVSPEFKALLYLEAKSHWKSYKQWLDLESLNTAITYYWKCMALVEILESTTVFHVGMGDDLKSGSLKQRLDSFSRLENIRPREEAFDFKDVP